jgi:DNA recombination protein RmuC
VLKVASELHERLSTMADHLGERSGAGSTRPVGAYNKAVGSYGSRVLVSARRLEGLAATRSTLDEVPR